MKKTYFTVGPSELFPTAPAHVRRGLHDDILSISHTSDEFVEIYKKVTDNLRLLFNIPLSHHIFFTGSSTESMECIIGSTVDKKSVHLITGGFAQKFYKTAIDLGKEPTAIDIPLNLDKPLQLQELNIPKDTELFCVTENDTSSGMQLQLNIFNNIKKHYPSMLVAVDIVSSVPYVRVDYSIIDIAFFSIQKGLGLPAGLGILIVNDAAIQKAQNLKKRKIPIGSHHSFVSLVEKEKTFKTPATPNVFYIYLLEKLTSDLLTIGLEKIRRETEEKAKLIYKYFDNHTLYKPAVHQLYRSITTPVINVQGKAEIIENWLKQKGLIVSKGYRDYEKEHIRIANFPAISKLQIKALLAAIDDFKE